MKYFLVSMLMLSSVSFLQGEHFFNSLNSLYPNAEASYSLFDVDFADPSLFDTLEISETISTKCVGQREMLPAILFDALTRVGENDSECIASVTGELVRLVDSVLKTQGYSDGIVMLRAFIPNRSFEVPRWHIDGNFFKPWGQNPPKFVITLKGPGTLFLPNGTSHEGLYTKGSPRKMETDRIKVAESFKDIVPVQAKLRQGAFFVVGNHYAAIHSEPNITEPRLFLSVMGANPSQIQELQDRGF